MCSKALAVGVNVQNSNVFFYQGLVNFTFSASFSPFENIPSTEIVFGIICIPGLLIIST